MNWYAPTQFVTNLVASQGCENVKEPTQFSSFSTNTNENIEGQPM